MLADVRFFSAAYALRRTSQNVRYFMPQSACDKIIVNKVNNDHYMRDTVVQLTGQWEAKLKSECGTVPTTWNLGPVARGGAVMTPETEMKLQELNVVDLNPRKWSWLLDPIGLLCPLFSRKHKPWLRVHQPWLSKDQRSRGEWSPLREKRARTASGSRLPEEVTPK